MSFHATNLGKYGAMLAADLNGFVPTPADGPWDLNYDHGTERTHDDDGNLTPYGHWWEQTGFPAIVAAAAEQIAAAECALARWRNNRS